MAVVNHEFDPLFDYYGRLFNVDPALGKTVFHLESNGNPNSRDSPKGAQGGMQIIPSTARGLGIADPRDINQAIYGGMKYLREGLDATGTPLGALAYYHGGPDRSQWGPRTAAYVANGQSYYPSMSLVAYAPPKPDTTPAKATATKEPTADDILKSYEQQDKAAPAPVMPSTAPEGVPMIRIAPPDAAPTKADDILKAYEKADMAATPPPVAETPNDISGVGRDEYGDPVLPLSQAPTPPNALVGVTPNDESGVGRDEYGTPLHPLMAQTEPHPDIVSHAGEGLVRGAMRGWRETQNILTPEAQASPLMQGFVGRQILDPLFTAAGAGIGAGNALMSGITGAIGAGTEAAGFPGLGRDLNMGLQVLPMAARSFPSLMREVPPSPLVAETPKFVQERMAPTESPLSATPTTAPTPESTLPPSARVTPTGDNQQWVSNLRKDVQDVVQQNAAMGVPNSVGAAATPAQLAKLTPPQMKAYRRMSELGDILAPASEADNTIHVKGSEPTLAERSADPVISQAEMVIRQRKPDDFDGPNGRLTLNNAARVNAFDDLAGTDPQVQSIRDQQKAAAQEDTTKIMKVAQPADGTPLLSYYDSLLNDPRIRERQDVVAALKPLRDALFDANGELKTDPMAYWGIHDNIMAKLAKAKDPMNASGAEKFAFDQLQGAKKATDAVLNTATGGEFQKYLDRQSNYFQQINSLEMLQKFRPQLTNNKGMIDANKFHRWLTDIAVRRGRPGVDPAMDITDDTMRGLISIDNDLKRAGNIDLGKARGSPTNLFFEVANGLGLAGAHAIMGASPLGGIGNVMMQQGMHVIAPKIRSYRLNSLVRKHLAPPSEGYNPLQSQLADEP